MNAQKESLKKLPESLKKFLFTSSRCAMKMKVELEEKNDGRLKYFLMEGRVYKIVLYRMNRSIYKNIIHIKFDCRLNAIR